MFRKVSAPKQPGSKVTQEVITSVSKTPSLTFLHSDTRARRVTRRDGIRCGLRARWGMCHPPGGAEDGPRPGAELGSGAVAPFLPSDTTEGPRDDALSIMANGHWPSTSPHPRHTGTRTHPQHTHMCAHTRMQSGARRSLKHSIPSLRLSTVEV